MMVKQIEVFTTPRRIEGSFQYSDMMRSYFEKNEFYKFSGCLIFQNNSNDIEPWVSAQELLMATKHLSPFVAVNPVYSHPYTIAQKIFSLSKIYERRIYLNFITGTSISDLESINGFLTHGERYDRLIEYMQIIKGVLTSPLPLTFSGKYYSTKNLRLPTLLNESLLPKAFIAGSSQDADQARKQTGSGRIAMAKSIKEINSKEDVKSAIHFGIIARSSRTEALQKLAVDFDDENPDNKEMLKYSMLNTDAEWKKKLITEEEDGIYNLSPFKAFNSDCPYLIGSYNQIAAYLLSYIRQGISTFIVEADEGELKFVNNVFQLLFKQLSLKINL